MEITLIVAGCFFIGFLSAYAEIISRYKNPIAIFEIWGSRFYILLNGLAAIVAYWVLTEFDILTQKTFLKVLVSGTSAMVVIRSSFANIKNGDKEIKAGVGQILQALLDYSEKSFDRKRSVFETGFVEEIMIGIDFEKAKLALPITCFNLMEKVPDGEQVKFSEIIVNLQSTNLPNQIKTKNLGILLSKVTGYDLLKAAVNMLGDDIKI